MNDKDKIYDIAIVQKIQEEYNQTREEAKEYL